MGGFDDPESPRRIPCRLYPARGQDGVYVIPVPEFRREGLREIEYHVDELENLLELVCHYESREGVYYGFNIEDEKTMEKALDIESLVPVSPEELEDRLNR